MGFLVLIAVGAVFGWLASILSRSDDRGGIALNVAVGLAGALVGGASASASSLMIGVSPHGLLIALLVASALLLTVNYARSPHAR
jgi:uncharacterized membrane protein YeaQ/YmgE (transglycosylase-associated protein family)